MKDPGRGKPAREEIRLPRVDEVRRLDATLDDLFEIARDYRRFDEGMHMNLRRVWEREWRRGRATQRRARQRRIEKGIQGYSIQDYALLDAAGFATATLGGHAGSYIVSYDYAFRHAAAETTAPHLQDVAPRGETVAPVEIDAATATTWVKRASRFCGADDVGVCAFDRRWVYDPRWNTGTGRADIPGDQDLGEEYRWVVVLVSGMPEEVVKYSPTALGAAATEMGYAMNGFTAAAVAAFIRRLGYKAVPSGNDTALSIPFAIAAGLGQLGRHSLLIHPKLGTRLRLAKVFTTLPLVADRPIAFGVTDYCAGCTLCARACPAQCISYGPPTREAPNDAAAPGMTKWYIDSKACRHFWDVNGSDCSNCMKVCPYGYATLDELFARPDVDAWWDSAVNVAARVRRDDLDDAEPA